MSRSMRAAARSVARGVNQQDYEVGLQVQCFLVSQLALLFVPRFLARRARHMPYDRENQSGAFPRLRTFQRAALVPELNEGSVRAQPEREM